MMTTEYQQQEGQENCLAAGVAGLPEGMACSLMSVSKLELELEF